MLKSFNKICKHNHILKILFVIIIVCSIIGITLPMVLDFIFFLWKCSHTSYKYPRFLNFSLDYYGGIIGAIIAFGGVLFSLIWSTNDSEQQLQEEKHNNFQIALAVQDYKSIGNIENKGYYIYDSCNQCIAKLNNFSNLISKYIPNKWPDKVNTLFGSLMDYLHNFLANSFDYNSVYLMRLRRFIKDTKWNSRMNHFYTYMDSCGKEQNKMIHNVQKNVPISVGTLKSEIKNMSSDINKSKKYILYINKDIVPKLQKNIKRVVTNNDNS